jgi:hypothetical protein
MTSGVAKGAALWETTSMEAHNFLITKTDTSGKVVGIQCVRCGKIALYMPNGAISQALSKEECKREDASQAAARIVKQATEGH